ncbi:MAG: 2-oxoacid:acceptor oxidoreductase subunit alpha [Bacillota bacterium]
MSNRRIELLPGNDACVLGAVHAGARFFAGYPICPASEMAELCSEILPGFGGIFVQMEDEIASIAAVVGASLAGTKAFTATSGPGFSLMQENIGLAMIAEVACVIINVQRYGPSTGIATSPAQADLMQARWGTHGDHSAIVIAPSSVQECYDLTIEAFKAAERFRTPVILMTDAALAHLREKVLIYPEEEMTAIKRQVPPVPVKAYLPYRPGPEGVSILSNFGDEHILRVTGLIHDERGFSSGKPDVAQKLTRRLVNKIEDYTHELPAPLYFGEEEPDILLVACGTAARAARLAIMRAKSKGISTGLLQLRTVWPFPADAILKHAGKARVVLVPEMNMGQLVLEVERVCKTLKVIGINCYDTHVIEPAQIEKVIGEVSACACA